MNIIQISEEGWKSAYYGKWLKAQERTRKKRKWNAESGYSYRGGWKSLAIHEGCSYCDEASCGNCSLGSSNKGICRGIYIKYVKAMQAPRTNWKRANHLVDQIVEAIRLDGVRWGYLSEKA
jgi:hypothetical protein